MRVAICLLVTVVAFDLAQTAFTGVTLDQWVSALLAGHGGAAALRLRGFFSRGPASRP